MKQAYTAGLELAARTKVLRLRELPLAGRALVKTGDRVEAETEVLHADLPGEIDILRLAERLSVEAPRAISGLKVKLGEEIQTGQLLAELSSFFGWFKSSVKSPIAGVVEFITESNAHLGIRRAATPLSVKAYLAGVVREVQETKSVLIESTAALLQGIFGVGGERFGRVELLKVPPTSFLDEHTVRNLNQDLHSKVVVGGSGLSAGALKAFAERNIAALITGAIETPVLSEFIGYDLGVSITGDEAVPFSLIITEGFGRLPISSQILDLLNPLEGHLASVNGATQVRAGALRPEVIVPLGTEDQAEAVQTERRTLEVGRRVRLIRVPHFGKYGEVIALPLEPKAVESGAVVRVAKIKLQSGEEVTVPRANLEIS